MPRKSFITTTTRPRISTSGSLSHSVCVFLSVFSLSLILSFPAFSQTADSTGVFTIKKIDTWKMHADSIGEDYTIYVLKTDDYDTTNKQLGVLYMTDGDWNMTVAMNCFSMLRQDYVTHEPLVVGIGYGKNKNMRFRDLDPKTGGPAFLSFIEKQVMPFIEKTYRTNKEKAIYGYSMGGMFTTYVLFNRADLFQKIYIGAPGNNGYELMPAARKYFENHTSLKSKVFIGVGSFESENVRNIDSFTTFLNAKKLPELEIRSDITPNANHGAALAAVMQNAIAFGYCDKHKVVKADPSTYKSFVGSYVYYEKDQAAQTANVFVKGGKLFTKWDRPSAIAEELLPSGANEFFVAGNEWATFRFKTENGKPLLVVSVINEGDYRLVKK